MNNWTHFLIVLFVLFLVLVILIRFVANRDPQEQKKRKEQPHQANELDTDKELEGDIITDPSFSFLKSNIFHKDRHDE